MDEGTHEFIDCVYDAAVRPESWHRVVAGVSEIFEGSAAMLEVRPPGEAFSVPRYSVGLREEYLSRYGEYVQKDLSWSAALLRRFAERFVDLSEVFDPVELEETDLYKEWMKPQGLAPLWPLGRTLTTEEDEPVAVVTVFRMEGQERFTAEECAEAEQYTPHLRRAVAMYTMLDGARRVHLALAEVMDRLPTGMFLLNSRRQVVVQNAAAERIIREEDGFHVDGGRPGAEHARENAAFQGLVADVMEAGADRTLDAHGFLSISRPSGKRPYSLMVTPLGEGPSSEAAVALFVSDPEQRWVSGSKMLEDLYSLTQAEAELLQLLAAGMSLEEAAASRGVSMNTARSHLKHMFAKTGVSRQGELVRMMVSGVGALREM